MKYLVMLVIFLLPTLALGAKNQRLLLRCLGEEEKKFHTKKQTGPLYDLNQKLISEMVQIPLADISPEYYQAICKMKKGSPSWKLLELSISQGRKIFDLPVSVIGIQKQMTVGMIDDYLEATKEILLGFISQVQAQAPSAQCLKEEIPELDAFFTDIKYLQEDIELKKIFQGRDLKIFERLEEYPMAFQRCRERLKKKPNPGSTTEAKKP
jgi:hypothetical protein